MNALQQFELEQIEGQEREGYKVQDIQSANWCLRKLQALSEKTREINALADAEIERVTAWRDKELEGLKSDVEFFTSLLTEYHAECLKKDSKAKTIKLPHGTLKARTTGPSAEKVDEDKLLDHLKSSGESTYIKVKESVDWSTFKKSLKIHKTEDGNALVLDENGEQVPGVAVNMGGTTFKVEVSE